MWEVIKALVHLAAAMLGVLLLFEFLKHLPIFVLYLLGRLWDLLCHAFSRRHSFESASEPARIPPMRRPIRPNIHPPIPPPARPPLSPPTSLPIAEVHTPDLPYECNPHLLTPAEKHFFDMLNETLDEDIYICPQVSFGGVLSVTAPKPEDRSYWNKVKAKRIDFLLCDKGTLTPLVAIELDDSSHDSPRRMERDDFVDKACRSAGLPILRFRVQRHYDRRELEDVLHPAIYQARISRGAT